MRQCIKELLQMYHIYLINMKNILFYSIIIVALGFIYSCKMPTEQKETTLKVNVVFGKFNQVGFIKASNIPGFDSHQYDTAIMTIYKYFSDTEWAKVGEYIDYEGPEWGNIGITQGYYTIDVRSKKQGSIFSPYLEYSHALDSVKIEQGFNEVTVYIPNLDQSLILQDTTLIDGFPSISTTNETSIFSKYGQYYYVYARKGHQTEIRYSLDGSSAMIPLFIYPQKGYILRASTGKFMISVPDLEIIYL